MGAIDVMIGANVRRLRERRDLTCIAFAAELGIAAAELETYERGECRIAASTLHLMARKLGEPLASLYRDWSH